ncbi:MAG: phytase [Vicinamibacterales bacterium]
MAGGPAEQGENGVFPASGLRLVPAAGKTGLAGQADDPAVWVHPTDPSLSVIIGANKNVTGGLHVFDLSGVELQFTPGGQHNNVDLRYGFPLGGASVDLVAATDRNNNQIDIYTIDPSTRLLTQVGVIQSGLKVYGFAMYHSRATGRFYGFVSSDKATGGIEQWEFIDAGAGTVGGVLVRKIPLSFMAEGMVADDELGDFYVGEEDTGIFKYGADPGDSATDRIVVDLVGSATGLTADVEGLAIYYRGDGLGYLLASSQGNDRYNVYRREGANEYLGTFQIPDGPFGKARNTDGLDVINMNLGPLYPQGLFVVQHDDLDFKMLRWQDIANALGLAIHTTGFDVRGDPCVDVTSVVVSPSDATVETGATVQLTAVALDSTDVAIPGCAVSWWSSDPGAATVGPSGVVTGVGAGQSATITASGGSATGTASVIVTAGTNSAPTVDAGPERTRSEGGSITIAASFADVDAGDLHTATVDWGDGSPVQAATVTEATGKVSGSHFYANDGAFTVIVTVQDAAGGVDQDATTVTIINVLPTANAGGPYSGVAGAPMSFGGGGSDPGADALIYEWDFAYDGVTFDVDGVGKTIQRVYPTAGNYTAALRVWDDDGVSAIATAAVSVNAAPSAVMYFSVDAAAIVGGLTVADEDVVATNGVTFSMFFDGSDVGLDTAAIDALAVTSPNTLLLSFVNPQVVPGIAGTVDDSDLVLFTATTLGDTTAGTFSLYFDGSDVGLSTSNEDLDAVDVLPDGRLVISTKGAFDVPGAVGVGQDLMVFTPGSTGPTTAGTWEMYVNGIDVDLSTSGEAIDALAVDGGGRLYLSTSGSFAVTGLTGADEDVFILAPSALGQDTVGAYIAPLFFDGSKKKVTADLTAIDLP